MIRLHKATLIFHSLILASLTSCGLGQNSAISSATPSSTTTFTPAQTFTPTATLTPTKTPRPTSTPDIVATQNYEGLQEWVEKLALEKIIPSVEGDYHPLDDFSDSLAKFLYYSWETYDDFKPANLIIQAKVRISFATTEDVSKSGCGFVLQDDLSHHGVFFALDGNANYWSKGIDRGSNYLDAALYEQNPDGVTLTLVLSNKALTFFVNDRQALSGITVYGGPFKVGPAILSGTTKGFGTRCDFTEMALWEMK